MAVLDRIRPQTAPPVVLKASGDLDLPTQRSFECSVFHQLDSGSVVVDLSDLGFLAVSALRSLLLTHRYAGCRGRAVVFSGPSQSARRLLSVSRLDAVLFVRRSLNEACADFRSASTSLRTTYWCGTVAASGPPD